MMERSFFRTLLGVSIGAFGGISLTTGVYPFVIAKWFQINSFEVMFEIRGFVILMALLWALGGGMLGWYGGLRNGIGILGLCGALTGFVLGTFAIKGELPLIMVGLLAGLIYGAVAGLIIGWVFPGQSMNLNKSDR